MTDAFGKSLSRQIFDIARLHRNRAAILLAEIGLHPGQEKVLKTLAENGRTMGELATALGVQAPTVTKMVSRLAAVGLVQRHAVPGDARQARVTLTREGTSRATKIDRVWQALDDQTFAEFDAKDKKRFKKLLRRMRDNLEGTKTADVPDEDDDDEDVRPPPRSTRRAPAQKAQKAPPRKAPSTPRTPRSPRSPRTQKTARRTLTRQGA